MKLFVMFVLFNFPKYLRSAARAIHINHSETQSYFTIKIESTETTVVKNSYFIAQCFRANNITEALKVLEKIKDKKANHNCWAFRGIDYERFNDDGEPSGTAGKPILFALKEFNVHNVLVVVTRYFGGIKLGTGGLQRAYQSSTFSVLTKSGKKKEFISDKFLLTISTDDIGTVYMLLDKYTKENLLVERGLPKYSEDSKTIFIEIEIARITSQDFKVLLLDMTQGRANIIIKE